MDVSLSSFVVASDGLVDAMLRRTSSDKHVLSRHESISPSVAVVLRAGSVSHDCSVCRLELWLGYFDSTDVLHFESDDGW